MNTWIPRGLFLLALIVVIAAGETSPVRASATFTVDSTVDARDANPGDGICATALGACTLRAAIEEADALVGDDAIAVPAGTYVLDLNFGTELRVVSTDNLTITGAGSRSTIVQAGGVNAFLSGQGADRILDLAAGASLTLADLELTLGGSSTLSANPSYGGAVYNAGDLTLDDVLVDHNQASNYGGAINQSAGSLTIRGGSIVSNAAGGNFGGGIAIGGGTATIVGATIDDNTVGFTGGAIYTDSSADLTLTDTQVERNSATGLNEGTGGIDSGGTLAISGGTIANNTTTNNRGRGGGVLLGGVSTIDGTEISGNTAGEGAGIYTAGSLTLTNVTVDGNHAAGLGGGPGAGIYNEGSLIVARSAITNNDATGPGGGIFSEGTMSVSNTTISGNASSSGGGIADYGSGNSVTLLSTTISNNNPSGLDGIGSGQVDMTDAIVAKQQSGGPDCGTSEVVVSHGHNLASDGSCSLTAAGDKGASDPLLAALADNGGGTETHALQAGSPAIDAGDGAACPATDQRGTARQGTCDIGAYELVPAPGGGGAPAPAPPASSSPSPPAPTPPAPPSAQETPPVVTSPPALTVAYLSGLRPVEAAAILYALPTRVAAGLIGQLDRAFALAVLRFSTPDAARIIAALSPRVAVAILRLGPGVGARILAPEPPRVALALLLANRTGGGMILAALAPARTLALLSTKPQSGAALLTAMTARSAVRVLAAGAPSIRGLTESRSQRVRVLVNALRPSDTLRILGSRPTLGGRVLAVLEIHVARQVLGAARRADPRVRALLRALPAGLRRKLSR